MGGDPWKRRFFFETIILRLHYHLWGYTPYVEDHLLYDFIVMFDQLEPNRSNHYGRREQQTSHIVHLSQCLNGFEFCYVENC